ncbi:MAG: hypothetical protein WC373_11840 [Smithella sp.]|jgi:hypothetical protein
MKKKPTGFIAICQCGKIVGALDYSRTDKKEAGLLLGVWLADGYTVEPRFDGSWSVTITGCKCNQEGEGKER